MFGNNRESLTDNCIYSSFHKSMLNHKIMKIIFSVLGIPSCKNSFFVSKLFKVREKSDKVIFLAHELTLCGTAG